MIKTDVCIVGAGPGGAATALKLSHLGIACVLVDKAVFPRDKICGDAISGKATMILGRIDPGIAERFEAATDMQTDIWGIRFVSPNKKVIDIPFNTEYDTKKDPKPGFVSRRIDFDHFLIKEVKKRDNIRLFENTSISVYEKTPNGYRLSNKAKTFEVDCRLLVVSNGANSNFSRHHAGLEKDPKHNAGAVRAYFKNVKGLHEDGFIELHFLNEINPGYFWVFPLPGGYANVGLGMRSDHISDRKFNLRKGLLELVKTHPKIKGRFENAELEGKVQGYGLPLGSKKRVISGGHFMLVGDAGHLVDPLTGEGIGNAIYSGYIAAEQAQQCFEKNDFSADFMRAYDVRVERVLGKEMQLSYRLQRLMARPWLVNLSANWVSKNRTLIDVISQMYADMEVRKKALNPLFWLKLMMGK
ncbi:MAG TPA: geranylgeranyl reductase family protein [Bacteroidetes bacterium]|nr:geranylgeranyl reductase family protein [Bacteroidota bacterium]